MPFLRGNNTGRGYWLLTGKSSSCPYWCAQIDFKPNTLSSPVFKTYCISVSVFFLHMSYFHPFDAFKTLASIETVHFILERKKNHPSEWWGGGKLPSEMGLLYVIENGACVSHMSRRQKPSSVSSGSSYCQMESFDSSVSLAVIAET